MAINLSEIFTRSASIKSAIANDKNLLRAIEHAGLELLAAIKRHGVIYSCGNGGSTSDAMHLTEELVARYKRERPGIKAMHFMDPGVLTCWSNDYAFEGVFERQVKTFCTKADALVAISTSGNSKNVINAVQAAKVLGTKTIGLLGKNGGKLASMCDIPIVVPADDTERIQECHITIIHAWCEMIEGA